MHVFVVVETMESDSHCAGVFTSIEQARDGVTRLGRIAQQVVNDGPLEWDDDKMRIILEPCMRWEITEHEVK